MKMDKIWRGWTSQMTEDMNEANTAIISRADAVIELFLYEDGALVRWWGEGENAEPYTTFLRVKDAEQPCDYKGAAFGAIRRLFKELAREDEKNDEN